MGVDIFRKVPGWLVLALGLGCANPAAEQGEATASGEPPGVFAGAEGLPPEMRAEIEQEDAAQENETRGEAEGAFGASERGTGAEGTEEGHAGLGALYYFYIGLGVVLFLYLVWLLRARHHHKHAPEWRLK